MQMNPRRIACRKGKWIGPACAALILALRLAAPWAWSAVRGLLVDRNGEALTKEVFSAFSGEDGAIPVGSPQMEEPAEYEPAYILPHG